MQKINLAFYILDDAERRRRYDMQGEAAFKFQAIYIKFYVPNSPKSIWSLWDSWQCRRSDACVYTRGKRIASKGEYSPHVQETCARNTESDEGRERGERGKRWR
ncbi:MAG: hypothetical protein ACK55Z_35245, partial [bacterium]